MAKRLTDKEKKLLLADYHTNNFSQRDLAKKYNVSVGTVSKLTKEVDPQNEHIVNAQVSVLRASSELENEQMNAIMNTAQDIIRRENLVFGALEKTAKITADMLEANKTFEKVNVGMGCQNLEPRELNMQDVKLASETLNNVGKGLGIISTRPDVAIQNNVETEETPSININIAGQ